MMTVQKNVGCFIKHLFESERLILSVDVVLKSVGSTPADILFCWF